MALETNIAAVSPVVTAAVCSGDGAVVAAFSSAVVAAVAALAVCSSLFRMQ